MVLRERNKYTPNGVDKSMTNGEDLKIVFSNRIKSLIGDETVSAFARRVSLNQAAIDRYIKGARAPAPDALLKISSTCGVSVDWLLGASDTPTGESNTEWRNRALVAEQKLERINRALGHALKGFEELQAAIL